MIPPAKQGSASSVDADPIEPFAKACPRKRGSSHSGHAARAAAAAFAPAMPAPRVDAARENRLEQILPKWVRAQQADSSRDQASSSRDHSGSSHDDQAGLPLPHSWRFGSMLEDPELYIDLTAEFGGIVDDSNRDRIEAVIRVCEQKFAKLDEQKAEMIRALARSCMGKDEELKGLRKAYDCLLYTSDAADE